MPTHGWRVMTHGKGTQQREDLIQKVIEPQHGMHEESIKVDPFKGMNSTVREDNLVLKHAASLFLASSKVIPPLPRRRALGFRTSTN